MKRYHEVKAERAARVEEEKRAGARMVKINMASGLIDQLQRELDPRHKFSFVLISEGFDPREWGVRVDFNNGTAHAENFFVFPSDELKTKIMLMG